MCFTKECIKEGILVEYLNDNASEVINMLAQEWDWNKAFEINARDAARETERRVRAELEMIVADKDTALADMAAENEALKAKLKALQGQ